MPSRILVLLLVACLPALLGACSGSNEGSSIDEVDEDFAVYSPYEVAGHFKRLTGVNLERGPAYSRGYEELSSPTGSGTLPVSMRYGGFDVAVAKNQEGLDRAMRINGGRPKVIANVMVQARSGGDPERDRAFARTLAVFDSLGRPPEEVRLPPEETPCPRAGIDPGGAGGKEGVCKIGQQTLTVVNADGRLELPGRNLSGLRAATGDTITSRIYGSTKRVKADGGFLAVTLRLENVGAEPLGSVRPSLVIDGKRYPTDSANELYLQSESPYPIQPGARETVTYLFDVPDPAAARAKSEGALEFSADERSTPAEYAPLLARIRLGGSPPLPGGRLR